MAHENRRMETRGSYGFARLWWAFLLQGFAGGFWIPVLTNILNEKGYSAWVAIAFAVSPLCALVSPLIGGALADERISAQKLYGWGSLAAGILITMAFASLDFGMQPIWFIVGLFAYGLASGSNWGMLANIALSNLENPEKQFPLVRLSATFGWVGAGFLTSFALQADSSPVSGYAAGTAHVCAGLIGFFLPNTPPLGKGKSWKSALGLGAFALFKNRDHAVLFGITALFSIPLTAFYMFSPELFKALGNESPAASMTIAQVTEVVAMLALGGMMVKYRLKTILLWGLGLSAVRYGLSGYAGFTGTVGWHLAGVGLHGVCYTFYFVTAQVYMNRRVDPKLRGQAQGLLSLMAGGIGPLIGAFFCGWLHDFCVDENGDGWENFWWTLAAMIGISTAAFAALYRGKKAGI